MLAPLVDERTLRLRLDDARFRVVVGVRREERVVEEITDGKPRRYTTAESRFEAVLRENIARAADANPEQRRRLYGSA